MSTITIVTLENRYTDAPVVETFPGTKAETVEEVADWLRADSAISDEDANGVAEEDVPDAELVDYMNNHPNEGYHITVREVTTPDADPAPSVDVAALLADLYAVRDRKGDYLASLDAAIAALEAVPTDYAATVSARMASVCGLTYGGDDWSEVAEGVLTTLAAHAGSDDGWLVEVVYRTDDGADVEAEGILTTYDTEDDVVTLWPLREDNLTPDFTAKPTQITGASVLHINVP